MRSKTLTNPWPLAGLALLLLTSAAAAEEGGEPEEGHRNTLKWSTASEVDNFGFDVYRGDSEDGPFVRLNEETIAGAGTTDEPSRYQYVDDTIDPTKAYWYYVESISMDGVRERFTPVFKAGPKLPAEEEGGDAGGGEGDEAEAEGAPGGAP